MNKKYGIILTAALVLVAAGVWYFFFKKEKIQYNEAVIKRDQITLKVLATGTVQPENRLQIKSTISGRADRILVKEGQYVYKGQVLAWISSSERAVLLDAARAQGSDEVKKWEEIYKPTPIIAPLNGTVILRSIEPGQTFTTGDAILVMADRLTIQAQVDETDLAQVRVGQKAKVTLDAYLDRELESTVNQVAYEAKTVNNVTTYVVDVLPNEKIDFLRSGMTANVTFIGETKENILVIPNEFIKYDAGKAKTLVKLNKNNEERELSLGLTDGKVTEVKLGLNEGETILFEIKKETKKSTILTGAQSSGNNRRR